MPGRKPKPTALKAISGNPGHRPLNRNEPKFTGVPSCPKHLNKVARAEWKRVSIELAAAGLLTNADRAALAAYCAAYGRWVAAEENIAKFGLVITVGKKDGKPGYPVQNPFVGIANTALDRMRRFLVEFGMTPSSRSRIQVGNTDAGITDDMFESFLRGAGAIDDTETMNDHLTEADRILETSD
jgi:P27 family predicted phage terminase small subunit